MSKKQTNDLDPEIAAMGIVHRALETLPQEAQVRVLNYVADKLKVASPVQESGHASHPVRSEPAEDYQTPERPQAEPASAEEGLEGISPVAKKWMVRSGLNAKALSSIFSLGGDEIDLIAKTVPGTSIRDRLHSVLLLKGIAAYLGSGAARFTHQQLKEASLHYKAYDSPNFAASLKSFSADASGDKNTGYTLTPRGLASATDMVKALLKGEKPD
jgi:hypothetical protein